MYPCAHCSISHVAKAWKQPKGPRVGGRIRSCGAFTHGILRSHEKGKMLPLGTTRAGLASIVLREIRQTGKGKNRGISLIREQNEQRKRTEELYRRECGGYWGGDTAEGHTHGEGRRPDSGW